MDINKLLEDHKTHWQWYKNFFNITILRYLVTWFALVPIIAKLLGSIHPSIKIKDYFEINLTAELSLSFSLYLLWLSSFFFVIALLLYQFFCPGFIKTYSSYGDYLHHQHSSRWIIWEAIKVINDKNEIGKLFERLNEKQLIKESSKKFAENEVIIEETQTVAYFKYQNKSYSLALPILKNQGTIDYKKTDYFEKEIFWEIFGRFSSSKKNARLTILILLFISGLIFLYTFFEHIYTGFSYLFK